MIPESFIQELLARVDVADVVGRYVQLRKGGANLIGLCPFHNEKSPSFTVSPSKQFYHCFGCGAHGSAISFLMAHTGATFPEAVRSLAAEVGLTVPESQRSARQREQDRARQAQRSIHHQLLDTAQAHYERQLASYAPAQQYLAQRGLSAQTIQRFGLGWVGPERQGLQRVFPNYDEAVMVEAGLVVEADDGRRYDRFRARLMFPIRNRRGDIVGFGGRLIAPGEPKYLNSPETPLFSKSHELYGLYENRQGIRQEGVVTVVEGYMDVVALANAGLHNAVATLGTATTEFHIRQLMRASDRIVFCFDGDTAGKRAAWRALTTCLTMLRDDVSLRFLFLPAEHDPDSYVAVYGAEAFRQQLQQSVALSRFMLDELAARHPMEEAEGRAACVHEALPLLQNLSDCTLSLQIKQEFAQLVRLTDDELAQRLTPSLESAPDVWAAPVAAPETSKRQRFTSQRAAHSVTPIAKQLLKLLAGNPELAQDLDHEALEIIVQSPTLVLVQELIVLANNTQSKHIGALLEAMDSDSDLAPVLEGLAEELVQQDDLPNPRGEWSDALRKLQVEAIKQEQSRLIDAGLPDSASRQRYQDLSKRLAQLMAAASP